jgi:hypothetical protein
VQSIWNHKLLLAALAIGCPWEDARPDDGVGGPPTVLATARRQADEALQQADQRILIALEGIVPEAQFHETPLADALSSLLTPLHITVSVDWTDLDEAAGLKRDTAVDLDAHDLPLRRVLELVLSSASTELRLGFEADDGALAIASQSKLDRRLSTVVYPIRDLTHAAAENAARSWLARRSAFARSAIASNLAACADSQVRESLAAQQFSHATPVSAELSTAFAAEAERQLIDLLMQNVLPDSWREMGGGCAVVHGYAGNMVVYQSRTGHTAVERFLEILRAAQTREQRNSD